ncbi:MAG: PAS domain S-box protein [Spiribacter sp.]|jgi:PAS domain S-box-containing protein|nr:PAS domain S-box protein [Spiribacter sp.]MDR9489886.1 PAS domain S-box protein [Spiribacter sp.]
MQSIDIADDLGFRLFKTAADHSFNAITITEAREEGGAGPIIYVNEAFTEMTGYAASEVLGRSPGMLQGPNTEPEVLKRLAEQIQRRELFHGETVNYRKDGSEFILEWIVTPVEIDGAVTHYVAIQHDVTGPL